MLSVHVIGGRTTATIVLSVLLATAGCGGAATTSAPSGASATSSPEAEASEGTGENESGGAPAAPGTDLTACQLVTAADVAAALGLDAASATDGDLNRLGSDQDPNVTECRWVEDWGGLSVMVEPGNGANTFADTKQALADRAEALDIGDGALWVDDLERGYFLKGSVLVTVTFTRLADRSPFREPTISVGTAAVGKV